MKTFQTRLAATLVLGLLLGAVPSRTFADQTTKNIYQKTLHSTAYVENKVGSGTAWVVDKNQRLLVTNHHVVEDQLNVFILFPIFKDGKLVVEQSAYKGERGHRGKVLDTDVPRDLAVVQLLDPLPEGVTELKLASESAEPSDRVHSIGNPGASDAFWIYTSGTVRQVYQKDWYNLDFNRKLKVFRKARVMETQSPVNHGDSGGPVVNDQGEVVAVVSSGKTKDRSGPVQLMTWHIDVQEVKAFVEQTRQLMNPKTANDFIRRGDRLTERGQFSDAIEDFSRAIKLDRKNGSAYQKRAWAFSCKGDHDTAIADCTMALQFNEDDAVSYENRGWAHERKGNLDKALEDYTKAIQADTKFSRAYNNRGVLYSKKQDTHRALADFTRAIEANPKNAVAWANRADTFHDIRDYDKAVESAEKALELNPFSSFAWNVRGWALRDKGHYTAAVENWSMALEFDDKNPDFYLNRGIALSNIKGQLSKAVDNYSKAIDINKNFAVAYFYRAAAYELVNALDPAQPDYEKAIQLNPKYKEKVKSFRQCFLAVANETNEPIKVYVQYEYQTKEGGWTWWPKEPTKSWWTISPGKTTTLNDDDWKVRARRVRIWAVGVNSGDSNASYRDRDLWLCPKDGYLAKEQMYHVHKFTR